MTRLKILMSLKYIYKKEDSKEVSTVYETMFIISRNITRNMMKKLAKPGVTGLTIAEKF